MASPANSEASEVRRRGRQRLIGAIALVAVLVVFVPMVLDSEPKPPRGGPDPAIPSKTQSPPLPTPPAGKAPSVAQAPSATPAEPAPASAKPGAGAQSTATGTAPPPAPDGKAARIDPKVAETRVLDPSRPAPPKTPPEVVAAVVPTAPPPTPRLEGFAVQVGAFRDEAKLEQAREKLAAAKVPHYTERLEAKAGPLTRLRAGPFKTREAAESALAQLKLAALDGKVVTLP